MNRPDAIVIGAGSNGLVAATVLADAGWTVEVLEATDHIGGAVRSAELAPGYVCDLFSAFYPFGYVSPVLRSLDLTAHGLTWTRSDSVLGHVFPDGRTAAIHRDELRTASELESWAPGDGDRWLTTVERWRRVRDPIVRALLAPLPAAGPVARLARTAPPPLLAEVLRIALSSARTYVQQTWRGEGARTLVTGNAVHADVSPEAAGSALYGWLLSMVAQDVGFPVPVGGSGMLAAALARRARAAGVVIRTGHPVTGVVVDGGRATGVRLADGTVLSVGRAVLADVPAPALFGTLVGAPALRAGVLAEVERFVWDNPTVKINWLRSAPVPWLDPVARDCGTVHFGADRDDISRWMTSLSIREMPAQSFLLGGQMTRVDPTRSPADTETMWAYTHLPHTTDVGLMAERVEATVERTEQILQRAAPGFAADVEHRVVQTPADLQRADPSLLAGAINAGTSQLSQQLVFRPIPGMGGARTPVRSLYLASASAHPGGGVHGACGNNAAVAALHDAGRVRGLVTRGFSAAVWRALYPDQG